ncbi:MAG TPA: hypothetical protein VMT03_04410 [Polyangia bacterium]|nr:hypothetical protein [Polyangia bacterium]
MAGAGAPALVAGAVFDLVPLVIVGLLSVVFGLAYFAALSRKVVKPGSRG